MTTDHYRRTEPMFRKTGRKNLGRVLFSPARKRRFAIMSILLATVFPLALSGAGLGAVAAPAAPAPVAQPVRTVPTVVGALTPAVLVAPPSIPIAPAARAVAPAVAPVVAPAPEPILFQAPSPTPAPEPNLSKDEIIDRVSRAFTEVRTAQGSFMQVDARGATSTGSFYINRPGRIRFDYDSPERMHIVSDGTTVSVEEPARKTCDAVPLSSTPLHLFLRSNVDLKRDGSVADVSSSSGSHFVTLVDRTGEAEGRMILEFRASDFELLGWRAIDGQDMETRVRLSGVRQNVSLRASLFVVRDCEDERR
jgi:outer membrane lipoprotein-sorting protein